MKTTYSETLYYGRYRDDCLVLWCGIEDKLDSFLTFLNENKNKHKRIVFSTKYNPRGPDINMILKKHLPITENEEYFNALYPKDSIMVAFKR